VEVGLVLKLAGVGMLVAIISIVLTKAGKDEQAMMVTVGGIIAAMLILMEQIGELLEIVQSIFGL
jgi:stage III sporulation protein AC